MRRISITQRLLAAALTAALVGGIAIGEGSAPAALGMWVFALFNVLVTPPGTAVIRGITCTYALPALLAPALIAPVPVVAAWLWAPAYMVAWGLARAEETPPDDRPEVSTEGRNARLIVAAIIAAVAIAVIAHRALVANALQQTAALFVGIPAILAIVVVLLVTPRSAVGIACKAVTVALLVSVLILGEGFLCITMSAPLFYLVAVAVGSEVDRVRRHAGRPINSAFSSLGLLALLAMSIEGTTPLASLPREEAVTVRRTIAAPLEAVARAAHEPPRFDRPLPWVAHVGFPLPTGSRVGHTAGQPRLVVRVRGGEMRIDGMEPRAGDLVLDVVESGPGRVRWEVVSDDSHMTHYLQWRGSTVEWRAAGPATTEVTWTLRYRRGLDPAWYFGPMQRAAARVAAEYLITAVATP